jgi:hypothetical protein
MVARRPGKLRRRWPWRILFLSVVLSLMLSFMDDPAAPDFARGEGAAGVVYSFLCHTPPQLEQVSTFQLGSWGIRKWPGQLSHSRIARIAPMSIPPIVETDSGNSGCLFTKSDPYLVKVSTL